MSTFVRSYVFFSFFFYIFYFFCSVRFSLYLSFSICISPITVVEVLRSVLHFLCIYNSLFMSVYAEPSYAHHIYAFVRSHMCMCATPHTHTHVDVYIMCVFVCVRSSTASSHRSRNVSVCVHAATLLTGYDACQPLATKLVCVYQ